MRERIGLLVVLACAAALAALLVFPHPKRLRDDHPESSAEDASTGARGAAFYIADAGSDGSAEGGTNPPARLPDYVRIDPESATACGSGMVLVDGIYCPFVGHTCVRYLDDEREKRDVCERYAPEVLCEGRLEHRRFCVDVFEYPNIEGVVPAVMVDWNDARRACTVEGKRLCTVEEWEFACEGPGMWPYPYGTERDKTACNIDRDYTLPVLEAFSDPWKISDEVSRLDKRVPSGALARCISPFGVRDMTGNVDEWVLNTQGKLSDKPYRSTLKGGYFGPIRARCRPITSTHNEWFSFYQVGFRCCSDPATGSAVTPAPRETYVPKRQRMPAPAGPSAP